MRISLKQLLLWCFLPGQDPYFEAQYGRERVTLSVRGIDRDNEVNIVFDARIDNGGFELHCDLEWIHLYEGDLSNFKSSDGSTLQLDDPSQQTEIRMRVSAQRVVIQSLHPNGLVSGKFIRAIAHDLAVAWTSTFHSTCYTVVEDDYSSVRELYWLWKGEGKTYFEQEWGLEYNCVSSLSLPDQLAYKEMAATAQDLPAMLALGQNEFPHFQGYQEIDFHLLFSFAFDTKFIGALELYRQRKGRMAFEDMTIRQVLREFMKEWTVGPEGMFTRPEITMLARNTFVYFFRNHTNFTALARPVLQGFDYNCRRLFGITSNRSLEDVDRMYEFELRRPRGRHETSGQAGSSSDAFNEHPQEQRVATIQRMKFFDFFTYFTFSILIIMMIFTLIYYLDIFHHESPHFDMYIEL